MWSFASLTCLLAGTWSKFFSCGASIPLPRFDPRPKGTIPRENIALGKFSVACKCIFILTHHLFLQCTTCLSGGIQQHSNTQTQDQTSDSKGLGSRYKCMCILQSWMCACQHTVFEELLFQWPIVHESTAQHPVLHMQMMIPIGIYKQDQRGFHSTTEGNSIYRLIFY